MLPITWQLKGSALSAHIVVILICLDIAILIMLCEACTQYSFNFKLLQPALDGITNDFSSLHQGR